MSGVGHTLCLPVLGGLHHQYWIYQQGSAFVSGSWTPIQPIRGHGKLDWSAMLAAGRWLLTSRTLPKLSQAGPNAAVGTSDGSGASQT
jgi:hypothetical protein